MSKDHGFVQFDSEEAAQKAIDKLNGTLSNDKQVFVGPFVRKQERESTINKEKFNNVFVKNISEGMAEEDLTRIFGELGPITSVVVMRDGDGEFLAVLLRWRHRFKFSLKVRDLLPTARLAPVAISS